VGRWFTIERDFHSSANRDVTLNTWIDSALALSQSGVQTAAPPTSAAT